MRIFIAFLTASIFFIKIDKFSPIVIEVMSF